MERDDILKKYYYDPKVGLGGISSLYDKVKHQGFTMKDVKQFVQSQEVSQLFVKPDRKRHKHFIVKKPDVQFQIDLIFFHDAPKLNEGYKYVLTCIDVFSKKAWVEPIRTKTDTLGAMKEIIAKAGKPNEIFCDRGSEFIDKNFRQYMESIGVYLKFSKSHAPFIERFNRSFKELVQKYLSVYKTKNWLQAVDAIVENYNNRRHTTTKMTPEQADKPQKNKEAFKNILDTTSKQREPKMDLSVGDTVRIRLLIKTFDKGYKQKWSSKTYTVKSISDSNVVSLSGKKLKYNRNELQKVSAVTSIPDKRLGREEKVLERARKAPRKPGDDIGRRKTRLQTMKDKPIVIGDKIRKKFGRHGWFMGTLISKDDDYWKVRYTDGDEEDLDENEVRQLRVSS